MRRRVALAGAVTVFMVVALWLSGCKRNEPPEPAAPPSTTVPKAEPTPAATEPVEKSASSDLVMTPGVGIGELKYDMSIEEVEGFWGKSDTLGGGGELRTMWYFSRGISLAFADDQLLSIAAETRVWKGHDNRDKYRQFAGKTSKGVRIGDSEEDVIAKCGAPDYRYQGRRPHRILDLHYKKEHLCFSLQDDRVVCINMGRPWLPK